MVKISVSRDPKKPSTSFNGQNPTLPSTVEDPTTTSTVKIQLVFFKILKFSGPSLLDMMSSTLQPHFLSGGLLWQMVIVIFFAHERKTAPNDYAPELFARIVQSPTKLNDKI